MLRSDFLAKDHLKFGLTRKNTFRAYSDSIKKASYSVARACYKDVSQKNHIGSSQIDSLREATWLRTFEKEIKTMGLTWSQAEIVSLDRIGWRAHAQHEAKSKKKKKLKT